MDRTVDQPTEGAIDVARVHPTFVLLINGKAHRAEQGANQNIVWVRYSAWDLPTGSNFSAATGDLDGDGDLDLLTGLRRQKTGCTAYRNDGDDRNPRWVREPRWDPPEPANASAYYGNLTLALADLDNDDDLDLALGSQYKDPTSVHGFTNASDGKPGGPVWVDDSESQYLSLEKRADKMATVAFGDLDNDGLLDFWVSDVFATSRVYRNVGSAELPAWELESLWRIAPFGKRISQGHEYRVTLGDVDGDGDLDVIAGHRSGLIYAYENEGTNASPAFTHRSDWDGPTLADYSIPIYVALPD